ncbi:MAG: hypothetical protein AAFZ46_08690 [Pseudomonadota bacterium]
MFTQDPFQYSAAGFKLAGMMVETQMRLMFAFTDATLGGKNPFLYPPISRRSEEADTSAKPHVSVVAKKPKAAMPKPTHKTTMRRKAPKAAVAPKAKGPEVAVLPAE